MPTRYLKPGVRDSESIDSLSPHSEILYYRLLVTVDDFGRYDARPSMVKAACFPIKDIITATKIDALLRELVENGLIVVYEVDSKPFLQMCKWDNIPRAKESKYPPHLNNCTQTYADVCNSNTNAPLTVTETQTKTETKTQTDVLFDEFWLVYPKKVGKDAALKAFKNRKPNQELVNEMCLAIARQKNSLAWTKENGQFIPNPATWLNQGRWMDEVQEVTNRTFGNQTLNKQEALEASNRAVVDRLLKKEGLL